MNFNKDYYAILGVLPTSEDIVIRAAYKALAQRYHPDRFDEGSRTKLNIKMAEINEAYSLLSDPVKRKEYNAHRTNFWADDPYNDESPFDFTQEPARDSKPYTKAQEEFKSPNYRLGDVLTDGGIVFYVDASGDHGLAAQPFDEKTAASWNKAKNLAEAHGNGWRLPTKDELELLYAQKEIVGNFASLKWWSMGTTIYWSSTKYSDFWSYWAWAKCLNSGWKNTYTKHNSYNVRAVRTF